MNQEDFFKKAENLYKKFKKQAKIKDLQYVAQISMSQNDDTYSYAIQFTNIADKLAPVTFVDKDGEKCLKRVEDFLKDKDYDFVEMKYHEAQAYHANETAKRHLKIIEDIKSRKSENKEEK